MHICSVASEFNFPDSAGVHFQHDLVSSQLRSNTPFFALKISGIDLSKFESINAFTSGDLIWVHCKRRFNKNYFVIVNLFKLERLDANEPWDILFEFYSNSI